MIWGLAVVLGVVLAVVLIVAAGVAQGSRTDPVRDSPHPGLDPIDTASIGATLEAIGEAHNHAQQRILASLVDRLIERRVPVRVVDVVPGQREGRVRFADGTTVRASGAAAGDLGILAAVIREGSILATSCVHDSTGVSIVFDRTLRPVAGAVRMLSIRIIGIDQPD